MERDRQRHQRPVTASKPRGRALVYGLPFACASIALALMFAGQRLTGHASARDAAVADGREGHADEAGAQTGDLTFPSGAGLPSLEDMRDLLAGPVGRSSLAEFLDNLEQAGARGRVPSASVSWDEPRPLPDLAGDVLKRYADAGSSHLAANGYVDLQGNVWCALVRGGAAWCDLVVVTTEDDSRSTARVTRMFAGDVGNRG